MYKKVLVPLDGSDLAECALSHVKSLFEDGSVGEVTLLNIVWFDLPWIDEYPQRIDINAIREPLFAASKKYLAEVESRLSSKGIKVKTESLEASRPADAITGLRPEKGDGVDRHVDPRLYRIQEADAGECGVRRPERIPCPRPFNQTRSVPDIEDAGGWKT